MTHDGPDRQDDRSLLRAELMSRWDETLPGQRALGDELWARWTEPHRRYHDPRHLLESLAALTVLDADTRVTRLALWFHDAVFTGGGDDEARSSELAASRLTATGLADALVGEVARLILVTRDHAPEPGDVRGRAVSDADLAILAAPPSRYDESVFDLRTERTLQGLEWWTWRSPILRSRLRDGVFFTLPGQRSFAEAAHENLLRELESGDPAG